jgi:tetratricopeptide (TPR) repeat protein
MQALFTLVVVAPHRRCAALRALRICAFSGLGRTISLVTGSWDNPTMRARICAISLLGSFVLGFLVPMYGQISSQQQQEQPEFMREGQKLMREGKLDEALTLYRNTLQTSPNSFLANIAMGSVLDLTGQGKDARQNIGKAIQVADTPEHKSMAFRTMAMSYAFEGDCSKTVQFEQQVFDYFGSVKNFFQQGEIADEAGRVCIDSGDLDTAYKWYQTGHDTGLKEPDIKPARVDLWEFRWEHAQARIAARRGNKVEAQKHVAAAKAILDKGPILSRRSSFRICKATSRSTVAITKRRLKNC